MDFDKHFDFIDSLKEEKKQEKTCCSSKDNYLLDQGMIKCKVCSDIISNISTSPEWRFYGNNDSKGTDPTRCGMPVNTLLPESSVGSSVSLRTYGKTMFLLSKPS